MTKETRELGVAQSCGHVVRPVLGSEIEHGFQIAVAGEGLTQSEREELKALQRETRELRKASETLRMGEAFDRHWCRALPVVAPSAAPPRAHF